MRQNGTQRIGYFDGQLLTDRDLQDDAAFESRLRGLHVRAMHNTWGVALGFSVSRIKGNVIEVGPGIAYDCHGREIISARTLNVGPPPAPGQSQASAWYFDLVISYREREPAAGNPAQTCVGGAFNPHEERPAWRWRFAGDVNGVNGGSQARPEELRLGEEVPLARFVVSTRRQIGQPDFSVRRNAQGLVRPHIAGDQVEDRLEFSEAQAALTMTVDTSQAGFSQTPHYFARLTLPGLLATAEDPELLRILRLLLGPFVTIRNAQRNSFQLDVRFALSAAQDFRATTVAANPTARLMQLMEEDVSLLTAQVNWVGVESNRGCAPPILFPFLFLYFTPVVAQLGSTIGTVGFDFVFDG